MTRTNYHSDQQNAQLWMLPTRVEEEHTYGDNSGQFGFGFSQCPQSQPGQWQEHVGQGVYQPHKYSSFIARKVDDEEINQRTNHYEKINGLIPCDTKANNLEMPQQYRNGYTVAVGLRNAIKVAMKETNVINMTEKPIYSVKAQKENVVGSKYQKNATKHWVEPYNTAANYEFKEFIDNIFEDIVNSISYNPKNKSKFLKRNKEHLVKKSSINYQIYHSEYTTHNLLESLLQAPTSIFSRNQSVPSSLCPPTPQTEVHKNRPDTFLARFYKHYSKKLVNLNSGFSFDNYKHYYHTICLTKWMMYCREIGILAVGNKKVTPLVLKKIFIANERKEKMLHFKYFKIVVHQVLELLFAKEEIETKGYYLIGIRTHKDYFTKMSQIGVIVSQREGIFNKYRLSLMYAQRGKLSLGGYESPINRSPLKYLLKEEIYKYNYLVLTLEMLNAKTNTENRFDQIRVKYSKEYQKQQKSRLKQHKMPPSCGSPRKENYLSFINEQYYDPYLRRYNEKYASNSNKLLNRIEQQIGKVAQRFQS